MSTRIMGLNLVNPGRWMRQSFHDEECKEMMVISNVMIFAAEALLRLREVETVNASSIIHLDTQHCKTLNI